MSSPNLPNMTTIDMTKKDGGKVEMTQDEMKRFQECMKNPEFIDLWHDYAKEISDPKNLKEQEEYLNQVEQEAKEQGDHSFTFIFPKPNFCVRMNCKERIYINVCDDDKVEEPVEKTTGNLNASSWEVPICLGKIRDDIAEDKECKVVDACYHPKATFLAKKSDKFMVFLVEIAVENMNHTYAKDLPCTIPMEFRRMSFECVGSPAAQTIRIQPVKGKEGELVVQKKAPGHVASKTAFKGNEGFADRLAASMGDQTAKEKLKAQKKAEADAELAQLDKKRREMEEKAAEEQRRADEFKRNLAKGMGAQPAKPSFPKYTITQQGTKGYEDCWNRTEEPQRKLPKFLKVVVSLPDVKKATDIDMHLEPQVISLTSEKHKGINGDIKLPYEVNPDAASAKFEKAKKVLTVTLPVVQKESEFEKEFRLKKSEDQRKFKEDAAKQAEEERLEIEAENRVIREAKEAAARLEQERHDKENARRKEVERMLEKAAEDERLRKAEEALKKAQEKEAALKKAREEQTQANIAALENTKTSMYKEEQETRQAAEIEHEKLMKKIKKEIEAAKLSESAAQKSRRKQAELPFSNQLVFELD
eukprot:TRINITY_DN8271_c0_g1_i2.p1 TRINITY_DN8271_c0_g1~~TRINITY_DN8271_c0_g1_i2.p1  ORF type:complete len:610 (+),score=214.59 TRINITY_DN8271_c0_g1_i2:66-1832(+)